MSLMRFSDGEQILQKGEAGTWFGLLVSGRLAVSVPQAMPLQALMFTVPGPILRLYETNLQKSRTADGAKEKWQTRLEGPEVAC